MRAVLGFELGVAGHGQSHGWNVRVHGIHAFGHPLSGMMVMRCPIMVHLLKMITALSNHPADRGGPWSVTVVFP